MSTPGAPTARARIAGTGRGVMRELSLWIYERRNRLPMWLRRLRCRVLGHHPNYHSLDTKARTTTSWGPCLWCRVDVPEGAMVERWPASWWVES